MYYNKLVYNQLVISSAVYLGIDHNHRVYAISGLLLLGTYYLYFKFVYYYVITLVSYL